MTGRERCEGDPGAWRFGNSPEIFFRQFFKTSLVFAAHTEVDSGKGATSFLLLLLDDVGHGLEMAAELVVLVEPGRETRDDLERSFH